ncbi:MAG TPA: cytochrome c [Verrucomicrobiota bacterium]|nr:cytochrome c [Verrucomicrobiota bacterium]
MRYFLLIFGVCVVLVMLIAGKRGDLTRNRPFEIFPDMDRQLKLRPQAPSGFFANGITSQLPPAGTVAQSTPMVVGGKEVFPFEDAPVNTGRLTGTTNFVESNPFPVTVQLMKRGQERYNIYCAPCHDQAGTGNGVVKKFGYATIRGLHEPIIVSQGDGEIFNTISYGKNTMMGYAAQIPVEDRWAIVAYVRALQLSRLGSEADLSPELRSKLK